MALLKDYDNFYQECFPRVLVFFMRRRLDRTIAEDLAQKTFLRVFERWETFRGEASSSAWAHIVAKSVWLNHLRYLSAQGRDAITVPFEEGEIGADGSANSSPEQKVIKEERAELLRTAIDALPPRMRQVAMLRIYSQLRYREIARLLNTTAENAKSLMSQAKNKLKAALADHFANLPF